MNETRTNCTDRRQSSVTCVCLALFCSLCLVSASAWAVEPADLVIVNAKVVTIDNDRPRANAIAVSGEWIVQVGTDEEIKPYIAPDKTRVIDALGRRVIPGLNDAHTHVLSGGHSLLNLDFRNLSDVRTIQKMVKDRADQAKAGELIRGRSWDHELFADKAWPTKAMLDAAAPDNPVVLSRVDGHSVWVNSLVLKASNITRNTPDPPSGTIVRDPRTGEPTGILKEKAQGLIKVGESLSSKDRFARNCRAFEEALALARQKGVTSLQDMTWGDIKVLEKFEAEKRLTARITFGVPLTDDPKRLNRYDQLRKKFPATNDWIRLGLLKDFIDGTLGSGTALMFEPFQDDPSTAGLPQMPYETLERRVLAADKMGFQVGIHAIGTRANHWILNAYDKAAQVHGKRDRRFRSEHAQILTDRDIPRFGNSGVIASMQPTHCITDKRFAEKRIGLERCEGAYAWQRLLDTQAHIAFGTDWPVEPLDPLEGLYAAVTRKDRAGEPGDGWFSDQRLSMEKAIELYTVGSAYAEFMEDRKGRVKPGYLADLVMFDRDLLSLPADQIMQAKVDYTIVGGKVVFQRKGQPMSESQILARAKRIHQKALTVDSHVDIPGKTYATAKLDPGIDHPRLKCDLVKMAKGGLDAVFLAVYVGQRSELNARGYAWAREKASSSFDAIHRLTETMYPERCALARSAEEVEQIVKAGKKAIIIGMENGYPIGEDLTQMDYYYDLGARYVTLSHIGNNQICDSSSTEKPLHNGLSEFGKRLITRMNRSGIMCDASHISAKSFYDVLEASQAPIIVSHSGCAALCDHDRNLTDEQLHALKKNGGVIQIVALGHYLKKETPEREKAMQALRETLGIPSWEQRQQMSDAQRAELEPKIEEYIRRRREISERMPIATITDFVNHIDHAVKVAGIDHVGIGTDFDGGGGIPGLNDHSDLLNVTVELVRRGYSDPDIVKILGGNFMRVWRQVEAFAGTETPSM